MKTSNNVTIVDLSDGRQVGIRMTRYKLFIDEDYQFEECDGGPMPMSREAYAGNEYHKGGAIVSYEDYLGYYGNPDRHVVIGMIRQDRCPCCKDWRDGGSLYGIDFMDDAPELRGIDFYQQKTYTIEELSGYLAELATDLDVAV